MTASVCTCLTSNYVCLLPVSAMLCAPSPSCDPVLTMADLTIEYRPVICGGGLKEPVCLRQVKQIDGMWFWRVSKADHVVNRLLMSSSERGERRLSRSDVLEQLQDLRNKRVDDIVNPKAAEDLRLDDECEVQQPRKKWKQALAECPPYVQIETPDIGDALSISVRVIPAPKTQPLWLELSVLVIDYLRKAIAHQVDDGSIKRSRATYHSSHKGVSYDLTHKAFRARRPSDGSNKYFKQDKFENPEEAAIDWASGVEPELAPIHDSASAVHGVALQDADAELAIPLQDVDTELEVPLQHTSQADEQASHSPLLSDREEAMSTVDDV